MMRWRWLHLLQRCSYHSLFAGYVPVLHLMVLLLLPGYRIFHLPGTAHRPAHGNPEPFCLSLPTGFYTDQWLPGYPLFAAVLKLYRFSACFAAPLFLISTAP